MIVYLLCCFISFIFIPAVAYVLSGGGNKLNDSSWLTIFGSGFGSIIIVLHDWLES